MAVDVLGIRHHGPGSARSLLRALEQLRPQVLLIEGPPEADSLIPLVADPALQPPVALLTYAQDDQQRAAFFPFARFSPEWQALQYGVAQQIPVRFIDLPMVHWLALDREERSPDSQDPLRQIAQVAGYTDTERWWERLVEERRDDRDLFTAVAELMGELRPDPLAVTDERERQREAYMRQQIRAAQKEGFTAIAVACGAWHVPALRTLPAAKADNETLKGLPKTKVGATWIPWTHSRLQSRSGYGAGVDSPGWYEHLWLHSTDDPEQVAIRWLSRVAALLREQDLDASSAQVIDAVRLAQTLAHLRGRSLAGLDELMTAVESTLLFANPAPLQLIHTRLIVGEALGTVPESAPTVPLQRDLQAHQRKLRLPPDTAQKILDLDLRKETDRGRSLLLHRLLLLDVPWGEPERATGQQRGTFHELWRLQWQPQLELDVIAAARWGNTVEDAATSRAQHLAAQARSLPELTSLAQQSLLAALESAIPVVLQRLQDEAAIAADLGHLMDALPPLAAVVRYGDVRQTDSALVGTVARGLAARIAIGLPAACVSLDTDAATAMVRRIGAVHDALPLLELTDEQQAWQQALRSVMDRTGVHGLVAGRCTRLLRDAHLLAPAETSQRLHRALSLAQEPVQAAEWLEGFLAGNGLLLLHDEPLLTLLDTWLRGLSPDAFTATLPLLKRTFATFAKPERRQIGEHVRERSGATTTAAAITANIDPETAALAAAYARRLLGWEHA